MSILSFRFLLHLRDSRDKTIGVFETGNIYINDANNEVYYRHEFIYLKQPEHRPATERGRLEQMLFLVQKMPEKHAAYQFVGRLAVTAATCCMVDLKNLQHVVVMQILPAEPDDDVVSVS